MAGGDGIDGNELITGSAEYDENRSAGRLGWTAGRRCRTRVRIGQGKVNQEVGSDEQIRDRQDLPGRTHGTA